MKNLTTQFAVLLLSTVCLLTGAYGQLTPSGDSYTNTAATTTNYGTQKLLDVESTQTTFIQFDLTAIPAGYTSADITKASLKLYVNAVTTAGSFNVDYVNGTWTESTIDASNAPALGTTIAASVPLVTKDKNQYILVDVTAAVQAWLSGTPNDGIALVANSPLNASFDSKENTTTSHAAELDIVFAGGGTLTGVTTASGSGLTGGGTSGTLNLGLLTTCASGQVLEWNGTAWACATVGGGGSGTVTSVATGTGLLGGPITTSGTLTIDPTVVPQLGAASNTFTGSVTAYMVNATTGFDIGGRLFDYGSPFTGSGLGNSYVGFAGNASTTGEGNVGAGWAALGLNTTGAYNTAVGMSALSTNSSGQQNTAVGEDALFTTGGGSSSTGSENTAVGFGAAYLNTTGFNNTAIGFKALYNNSGGVGNTAIGSGSLLNNTGSTTTGDYNTAIGYQAGPTANLTNSTAIGYEATVSESNALVLGGTGVNAVKVGIGTAAPGYTLDAAGTIRSSSGGFMFPDGTTQTTAAVAGGGTVTSVATGLGLKGGTITTSGTLTIDTTVIPQLSAANNFSGSIIAGNSSSSSFGVLGESNAASGQNYGVGGLAASPSGYGVWGVNAASGGIGVYGYASAGTGVSGGGLAYGVQGLGLAAPSGSGQNGGTGIYALGGDGDPLTSGALGGVGGLFAGGNGNEYGGNGVTAFGGGGTTPGDGIAAYVGSFASPGWAGYFSGSIDVTGTITAGTKDFKIDHPLDPANKYLFHSSVESSEMMNIYTGNVNTDGQGQATVQLPDWFEVLNTDFRYQLTVIGQFAQAIVSSKVASHQFSIRTDKPNVEVSWQITGVRQDAYAKAHPLVVEQAKNARESGHYIHPELYGAPEEQSIDWARHPAMMKKMQAMRARQLAAAQGEAPTTSAETLPLAVPPVPPAPPIGPAAGQKPAVRSALQPLSAQPR